GKLENPVPDQSKGTSLVAPNPSDDKKITNTGNVDGQRDVGGNILINPRQDPLKLKDVVYLSENSNSKIDTVIGETLTGRKNFTSTT
ncbi:hypothetical protein R0K17_26425, partial [Planococcus sp. SIMBA_143]